MLTKDLGKIKLKKIAFVFIEKSWYLEACEPERYRENQR